MELILENQKLEEINPILNDKIENLPKNKSSKEYNDGIRKSIFEVKQRIS